MGDIMKKVIYVNTLNTAKSEHEKLKRFYDIGSDGFYKFGIGQFIAAEFMKRGYPIEFELWRSDTRIKSIMVKKIDGITCRVFPAIEIKKPFSQFSLSMLIALRKESKRNNTIVHFMMTHNPVYHIYALLICGRKSFATHLGDPNPLWRYNKNKKLQYWFYYQLEKRFFLKSYKCIFTICREEWKYYNSLAIPCDFGIVYGVCREDNFVIKDRKKCREKLGLPLDKKIILQVGRAVEYRGFDWILELLDHYEDNDEYYFIMAGINTWDPYYEKLKTKKCLLINKVLHTELPDWYNAADLFIFFIVGEKVLTFGGTGYVPIESLFCGTPVIATSLHHIKEHGIEKVSRIPDRQEDVIPMIEEMIANPPERLDCRNKALEIFSWNAVLEKYWGYYSKSKSK